MRGGGVGGGQNKQGGQKKIINIDNEWKKET